MQVPLINGIYADAAPDLRTSYPRNYVPVPKRTGIAEGYLKPADGLVAWGAGGPGRGRGGINWKGTLYRVMGSKFVSVSADGAVTTLGDVGGGGQVTLDYSFDRLGIASSGRLYYWNGSTLTQVIDPDLGAVVDVKFIAGYWMTTDGVNIVQTDIADPMSVNPLNYGSAESDPDPVKAVDELRDELYAFGRNTIQTYRNVGSLNTGSVTGNFAFEAIEGATVPKGVIGTYAYAPVGDTFIFMGSGRNEAPAVYRMLPGDTEKLSTREIDRILEGYTEAQLAAVVCECEVGKNHQFVKFHLPDQCLVYDTIGSKVAGEHIWHTLDSGTLLAKATYRGRNFVWCYDRWTCEDPTSSALGTKTDTVSSHFGATIGWEFGTQILYGGGNDAIMLEIELVGAPGRVPLGADPTVWTSYSHDGQTWSQDMPKAAGQQGERRKRLAWRRQGRIRHCRMQRFRGTSEGHMPVMRLECQLEALLTRPGPQGQ